MNFSNQNPAPSVGSLLDAHDWSFPAPIAYGPGRLSQLGEMTRTMDIRSPMIVTDRGSADLPFIGQATRSLAEAGITCRVFSEISTNPGEADVRRSVDAYRSGRHDAVIAVGGGSGMDAGKATAMMAHHDLELWQFDFESETPVLPAGHVFPKLICIPSTAGTGAETESTAMVTDPERAMKLCVWHPELKPSLALLDPKVTLALPPSLTAWTGIDALVHAVEAYCVPNFHPMCDGIALEALTLIGRYLPIAVAQPNNLLARGGMQVGACLAGIAFLKGLGLVHAISHMVGAEFNTHHGLTNAIVLPTVLRFNAPSIEDKLCAMTHALQLDADNFDAFYLWICSLLDQLDIPKSLSDVGIPVEAAGRLAEKAYKDTAVATNPRSADIQTIEKLIVAATLQGR